MAIIKNCPFLSYSRCQFCRAVAGSKMIVRNSKEKFLLRTLSKSSFFPLNTRNFKTCKFISGFTFKSTSRNLIQFFIARSIPIYLKQLVRMSYNARKLLERKPFTIFMANILKKNYSFIIPFLQKNIFLASIKVVLLFHTIKSLLIHARISLAESEYISIKC